MSEEINFDDVEFGEPIEEREPNYRDGYIRGIYRARNIIDSKQKEIERLNNIINEANKILSNILVVSDWEHKGKYRPIKNTTSQEVYKSVCMLYGILKTPYRSDYGSLQELKGSDKEC